MMHNEECLGQSVKCASDYKNCQQKLIESLFHYALFQITPLILSMVSVNIINDKACLKIFLV